MNRLIFILLLVSASIAAMAQQKQVCFTVDDLPLVTYGIRDSLYHQNVMGKLVAALTSNEIPAIGFVNEIKLYRNGQLVPFQVRLLSRWLTAGLELGNHTFSHRDYNNLTPTEYFKEITKGEKVTRKLLKEHHLELKYFRHPFLHVGPTKAKSDSLHQFLLSHAYRVAPVTLDNSDYLFAVAYKRAQDAHDQELMKKIGTDYIAYMEEKVMFYERLSEALFGRQIKQILLLHANALNSDYLPALADMFRKHDYDFISLSQAMEDPAYQTPVTVFGKWGISWLDRWALSQGKSGDFFKGDPEPPAYIRN